MAEQIICICFTEIYYILCWLISDEEFRNLMELQSLPPTTAAVIVVAIAVTIVANAILYTVIATRVKLNIYFPSYQL